MITILEASLKDISIIQNIAYTTWPLTYGEILSKEQLDYMLDLIYSDEALTNQYKKKEQLFYLIVDAESTLGFIGIEHHYKEQNVTRIHKIYLLSETQGKGIGKKVIDEIAKMALENNSTALSLNVNRYNTALTFYKKIGFEVIEEVDIEIGNGYFMEDYVMEKKL
ncbi:GNAT family N-acetyltransferase [Flavobacterium sp. Fl-77]|uniref:GNAT family N-acetyltransferase n=1 Tax=Flavobacterium flavipigmentatum TaxID=2893884 RepID=A0AAJ2VXR9_9FLAO|nr:MULTISPECIES: GNAT family N-acetyltransferase [unclassified Flavobacterium]MDX6181462.1 GNAT family N-acetyltransferase [Flavobacterium sp. Fl-33]MDX6185504.1 GNAT family N-acetyltransferase [Flavobacterium sp. Fl-77]UFH37607.1 GNAT family N-acetyltransferase [Flavobacterium sp. F-70]